MLVLLYHIFFSATYTTYTPVSSLEQRLHVRMPGFRFRRTLQSCCWGFLSDGGG
jgi:hypothetical protein